MPTVDLTPRMDAVRHPVGGVRNGPVGQVGVATEAQEWRRS